MPGPRAEKETSRYGIGEWYGRSFLLLAPSERRALAALQATARGERPEQPCPARSTSKAIEPCSKEGGVCSLRMYTKDAKGRVDVAPGPRGSLCTTCPERFEEGGLIYRWIGQELLGSGSPIIVGEVGFLQRVVQDDEERPPRPGREDVGRIDSVLVHPDTETLRWCALEKQGVYFSGASMSAEFRALRRHTGKGLPFPSGHRRPDYRSSGPKRLMPQLQIKVPALRRWGRKMAVVVDEGFFRALGPMQEAKDVSNADIAWFVVRYDESGAQARLRPAFVCLTTLEHAVEGLTAGVPVTLDVFEAQIREKLSRISR